MSRFQGKSLLLKTEKLVETDKLLSFMAGVESGGVTNDGYIVMKSAKQMNFRNGEVLIAKRLGLESSDIQILSEYHDLLDEFLIKYMNGDYDLADWRYRFGKMQCDEYMKTISKMKAENLKNRNRTKFIKEYDINTLEELGMVNEHNRAKIVQMKEAQREEAKEMQLNPDLSGPFTWTFRHFEIPTGERCAVPSGKYEDVPVTIYGEPGRTDVKKKCWWIHSDVGGFGKTYFLDKFEETYNARVVSSSKNCMGIPKNT
jgi:hypothetical protein